MTKIQALTIEEALTKASLMLKCSVTSIEYEVIQYPRKGFLGFCKKDAILVAQKKQDLNTEEYKNLKDQSRDFKDALGSQEAMMCVNFNSDLKDLKKINNAEKTGLETHIKNMAKPTQGLTEKAEFLKHIKQDKELQNLESKLNASNTPKSNVNTTPLHTQEKVFQDKNYKEENYKDKVRQDLTLTNTKQEATLPSNTKEENAAFNSIKQDGYHKKGYETTHKDSRSDIHKYQNLDLKERINKDTKAKETSHKVQKDIDELCATVQAELKDLLSYMPLELDTIEVSVYNDKTLFIFLDGKDSALIIGEKGYRYKALSYLLSNWIQPVYGFNIKLEVSQFLKNQEAMIDAYIKPIIEEALSKGSSSTKELDGVLAHIALKKLRAALPNKYVSFRTSTGDKKYIIINDFK
ncbi:hypothetical protein BKH43_02080 [Helicobacter sp. 13S00401-1]|uniref:Jag N-terminal domain-containing protein n=1 Tax=Helicobacter sp. 13S00401-1 TaxID=1905758 RepID=UPI000BA549AA|nr:Jag N-terminal domain-containing protein [Helicobacter sp. 13S00401-1]PAF51452.1 hypothetical protein BKH43_02080 [Helicobacter sp. 13S00401-1]